MPEDILTFERLSEIERKERKDDTLAEVDEDFYQQVADYLDRKDQIAGDDRSEFRKIKHVLEDIIDSRQKKLLKLAFLASRTDFRADNVLPEEQQFMADIRERITEHRSHLEQIVLPGGNDGGDAGTESVADDGTAGTGKDTGSSDDGEDQDEESTGTTDSTPDSDTSDTPAAGDDDDAPSEETEEPDTGDDTADDGDDDGDDDGEILFGGGSSDSGGEDDQDTADDEPAVDEDADGPSDGAGDEGVDTSPGDGTERGTNGMVMLIATEDIGAFMGVDLEEYGPFEEGDEIQVPADNADALLEDGRAEEI